MMVNLNVLEAEYYLTDINRPLVNVGVNQVIRCRAPSATRAASSCPKSRTGISICATKEKVKG